MQKGFLHQSSSFYPDTADLVGQFLKYRGVVYLWDHFDLYMRRHIFCQCRYLIIFLYHIKRKVILIQLILKFLLNLEEKQQIFYHCTRSYLTPQSKD